MPLIILTGFPCSGLTHRAQQLASALESTQSTLFENGTIPASKPRYKINVVATHDASHPRTVYDHARTEKEARGVAYTRAKRLLGKDSFVILDGMNYIKGYRYQLWCEAKALGTTCCVVHVGTPVDQCVANNEARIRRQEEQSKTESKTDSPSNETQDSSAPTTNPDTTTTDTDPYPPDLLNNLIFRYEEPSTHSRWDKPLFTVPWADPDPPIADIWSALTGIPHPSSTPATDEPSALASTFASTHISPSAPSLAGSLASTARTSAGGLGRPRVKVRPHQATVQPIATSSTALYDMEKRTSAIVSAIRSFTLSTPSAEAALAQSTNTRGQGISIPVPEASTPVFIPAHVASTSTTDELAGAGGILALPRLQRLRRQWISLNRAYIAGGHASNTAMSGGLGTGEVGDAFVRFLNAEFGVEEE